MFKTIITILALTTFAIFGMDDYDYDKAWKEVEKYMEKGLPKSALSKVEEIYTAAKKDNNAVQQIKATNYQTVLVLNTEELGLESVITTLEDRIAQAKIPVKNILQSTSAELMQQYFQQNYWQISQRTDLSQATDDIRTWSPNNYRNFISELYKSSISPDLVSYKSADFKLLIPNYDQAETEMRPDLYGLLLDRAMSYFGSSHAGGDDAVDRFLLNDPAYLATANKFLELDITSRNKSSLKYNLLKLYQDAISYAYAQEHDKMKSNYDLTRLQYVYTQSNVKNKETLYLKALEWGEKTTLDPSGKELYGTAIIRFLRSQGQVQKAIEKADLVKEYATPEDKNSIDNILQSIRQKEYRIYGREVYGVKEKLKFRVDSKNMEEITVRITKVEPQDLVGLNNNKQIQDFIKTLKPDFTQSVKLPGGYNEEASYFTLKDLSKGLYVMQSMQEGSSFYLPFWVSDIGFNIVNNTDNNKLVVRSRETGKPIAGAKVNLFKRDYSRNTYEREYVRTLTAGEDGVVYLRGDYRSLTMSVNTSDDHLDLQNSIHTYFNKNFKQRGQVEIFTDRAIYRPGQTVHFKGLVLSYDDNKVPELVTSGNVNARLLDANGQEVHKASLTINEFGAVSGVFSLPEGLLTGNFTLTLSNINAQGSQSIRVEEYKRPKFEITLDKPKDQIKLNDSVAVAGKATYYSGAPVINGEVRYVVNRSNFPIWGRGFSYFRPQISTVMVDQGVVQTDEQGNFTITFKADSDGAQGKFDFTVEVDVLDSNGETRSQSETISLSTLPFNFIVENLTDYDVADTMKVKLFAVNANQEMIEARTTLEILKLEEKDTEALFSFWEEEPDNLDSLEIAQAEVISTEDITLTESGFEKNLAVPAGVYVLKLSSMEEYDGKPIVMHRKFVVTDFENGEFPASQMLYIDGLDKELSVGEELSIALGTPVDDLMVYYHFINDQKIVKHGWLHLDNKTTVTYKVRPADQGGITLLFDFIKHNKYHFNNRQLNIPWSDKKLDVKLETSRDITTPGAKEKWIIKLSGKNKEQVTGEMLATMYDASLDYFVEHSYSFNPYPSHYAYVNTSFYGFDRSHGRHLDYKWNKVNYNDVNQKPLPFIEGLPPSFYQSRNRFYLRGRAMDEVEMMKSTAPTDGVRAPAMEEAMEGAMENVETDQSDKTAASPKTIDDIPTRENLNETVFFYPHIGIDGSEVTLEFDMNEALTTWKLLTFAHDKDLRYGMMSHEVKTQKDLMILPNAPRFLREGDTFIFPATISNMTDEVISVDAGLLLTDVEESKRLNEHFGVSRDMTIKIPAGGSHRVEWTIDIPEDYKLPVKYKVWAKSSNHTDAESNILPVVTNRKLVTETEILDLKAGEQKSIEVDENKSKTAQPFSYTFEYTAHPVWYAIQATPYIVDQDDKNIISVFNKYFVNTLAAYIVNANPRIKQVFDTWKNEDSEALLSNLEKNSELKYALLNETPYVRAAQNETEQKQRIAMLFEANNIKNGKVYALRLLKQRQNSDGGFGWYSGARSSVNTTQTILEGLAHLEELTGENHGEIQNVIANALNFIDRESEKRYIELKENMERSGGKLSDDQLDALSIQYLYTRKYFTSELEKGPQEAYDYYYSQAKKYWLNKTLQQQGMIALVGLANEDTFVTEIVKSLKERSFYSEVLGRYWNEGNGYHWYDIPIETHALLVELFNKLEAEAKWLEDMKIWLLKQKQTNHWGNDRATVKAIYALLLHNGAETSTSWVEDTSLPTIIVDSKAWKPENSETGTGYVKRTWTSDFPKKILVKNNGSSIGWGAGYYQFFEDLDRIEAMEDNPLSIGKTLYLERIDDSGRTLIDLDKVEALEIGDRVITRIEIKVDRSMDYIHLKEMRPLGFEPENTLSGYRWKEGFGYYESTRDLSSNFFIHHLPKGTYVFEYPQRVVHSGVYSSGIATIQSMYAPEFTSHSAGMKISVE